MVTKQFGDENRKYFTRMHPKTVTCGGGSVMLWRYITFGRLGPLIKVNERLNSRNYIS